MDWYYTIGAEQKGPVGEDEFQRLAQQGVITSDTLVWREGLAGWERHGGNTPPALPGGATPGTAVCAACGRRVPASEIFSLGEAQYCAACKPQILQRIKDGKPLVSAAAEATRNTYLAHEASVKSVGVLYYIGGAVLFFIGINMLFGGFAELNGGRPEIFVGGGFLLLVLSVAQFWVGTGLRRLRPWARVPAGILSGLGLLGFPIGTIINGYILYLICSKKSTMVFSEEYQAIIKQTPHIKYRTSMVVWIFLGLILLVLVVGIAVAIFKGS